MAVGSWMMTCLLLAPLGVDPDVTTLPTRDIVIPLRIDPSKQKDISKLILVYSTDQGANWTTATNVLPDAREFSYVAPGDGLYYFTVLSVDQNGKQTPEDPRLAKPGAIQKVNIDTRPAAARTEPLPTVPAPDFRREAAPPPPVPVIPTSRGGENDWNPNSVQPVSRQFPVTPPTMDLQPDRRWNDPQPGPSPGQGTFRPNVETGNMVVASSAQNSPAEAVRLTPGMPAVTPRGTLPALQKVSRRELTLELTISKYGLSGVGSVELYVTKDDGRTWQPFSGPQTVDVPVPTDMRSLVPLKQSLTVVLPGEGTYGFYVIMKNKVGLGKAPPQNGDPPDVRVELDETSPVAILRRPVPDPDRRDAVLLTWEATDNRPLPPTPITLEWAEREGGDWKIIGGGELRNMGRYSWQVPPGTPPQVYLRLTVRDEAGNIAVAQSPQPQLIDLTEPEVKISAIHVTGGH